MVDLRNNGRRSATATPSRAVTPEQADWMLVEVRSADGELLAVADPIFFK